MLAPFPTNLRSFLLVLTSVLVSANCFAVSTKVNRGPIHARTFNFVSRLGKPEANIADNREAVHKMIQSAITKNLAARGVNTRAMKRRRTSIENTSTTPKGCGRFLRIASSQ